MKLWVKIIKGDKLLSNLVVRNSAPLEQEAYEAFLSEICQQLDLSTPISLPTHFSHIKRFNIVEYKPRDFIEPVAFTKLTLENVDYDN
jgi:hypothetical protein